MGDLFAVGYVLVAFGLFVGLLGGLGTVLDRAMRGDD